MSNLMLSPAPWFVALDTNGVTISGALIYTVTAGGVWPGNATPTYQDAAGTVLNANPVVCDSAGRCVIFLPNGSYKFIYATAAGVTIRTQDNIIAVSSWNANVDIPGVAGELLDALDAVYLADGTGGTTAGRWYKADATTAAKSSTANVVGLVVADVVAAGDSGSIRLQGRVEGFVALTPGAEYYVSTTPGLLTATAPSNRRFIGVADLSTSLVIQSVNAEAAGVLTGGIAISGQVAQDLIYAASASQLGRLPLTALQSVRKNAANDAIEAFVPTETAASQAALDGVYAASATRLGRAALTAGQALRKNVANDAIEAFVPTETAASQAALDGIFAMSATQLGRVALTAGQSVRKNATNNGMEGYDALGFSVFVSAEKVIVSSGDKAVKGLPLTALQSVRKNVTNTALEAYTLPVAIYTATLAPVANTTVETTILSFTVPAPAGGGDSMADGDVIEIPTVSLEKNNKGTSGTAAVKINAGAGAQVTLAADTAYADSATEYRTGRRIRLQRVGAGVEVLGLFDWATNFLSEWRYVPAHAATLGNSTPTNFTSDFVVSVTVTLSAANATFYIKPQAATVIHYKS